MKFKLFTIILVALLGANSHAQNQYGKYMGRSGGGILEKGWAEKKESKVEGTPYSSEKFMLADVEGASNNILIRYNNQSDEIEIEYEEKILILPKKQEFGKIIMLNGKIIKLLNYTDIRNVNVNGYLYEIYVGNKTVLYLKERSVIIPERVADNSYSAYSPPRYSRTDDEYYFSYKGAAIVAFPDSKKELIAMYPENKKEIEDFLKTNKLKFKTEADLIKIATFLDSL